MTESIQLRQANPEESEKMANLEEPDNDVYGYLARSTADELGDHIEVEISEEAEVEADADGVTGKGTGNYVTFETPGGAVVGLGVHLDVLADVFGRETERDEDGNVTNAPDSIGLAFSPSSEENWTESDDDDSDEEEVEIEDEEVGLVESDDD